jgi:hypothetical protein
MFSVDLSTREGGGHAVVALRGELDIVDAAAVAAAPRQLVLRVLTMTRLADSFCVHASVEKAAAAARRPQPAWS